MNTFGIALLIMSLVFFAVGMALMIKVCIEEERAQRKAKQTGGVVVHPVIYDGRGKFGKKTPPCYFNFYGGPELTEFPTPPPRSSKPLYVENLKEDKSI